MGLWLAIGAALGYAGARILLGYPPAPGYRVLARREVAFLDAAAEAMYPPGGPLPPSGRDARCAPFLDGYLGLVPPRMRRLMRLLFFLMEHATLFFPAPPPRGWRRFSSLSPAQREAALEAWRSSRFFPRRLVFTSLRAVLTNAYLADAEVLRHLGLAPWAITPPVCEADLLYPPIGRPPSAIRHRATTAPSDGTPLDPAAPRAAAAGARP
jgi:hypothetical protein